MRKNAATPMVFDIEHGTARSTSCSFSVIRHSFVLRHWSFVIFMHPSCRMLAKRRKYSSPDDRSVALSQRRRCQHLLAPLCAGIGGSDTDSRPFLFGAKPRLRMRKKPADQCEVCSRAGAALIAEEFPYPL